MTERPSALTVQILDRLIGGPYPVLLSRQRLHELEPFEARMIGQIAAAWGLTEYHNQTNDTIKWERE